MSATGVAHPNLSIVIPAFNEARTIRQVVFDLSAAFQATATEIIVVDDGSTDNTRALVEIASSPIPCLTISHEHNLGKGAAIRTGIAHARGTYICLVDADLECSPRRLSSLVATALANQLDAMFAVRIEPEVGRRLYRVANRAFTRLFNSIHSASLADSLAGLKIVRGDILRSLQLTANDFAVDVEIASKLLVGGHRVSEVFVSYSPRTRRMGKKLRLRDGFSIARMLLKTRQWTTCIHSVACNRNSSLSVYTDKAQRILRADFAQIQDGICGEEA